jgi:hypothetical protein
MTSLPVRLSAFWLLLALLAGLAGCATSTDLYDDGPVTTPSVPAKGSIEGYVYDQDTVPPTPVVGAKVYTLPHPDPGVRTNGAGYFRLDGVNAGVQAVVCVSTSGKSLYSEVRVSANFVTSVSLIYGIGVESNRWELGLLTQLFTPGLSSLATVGPGGAFFQYRPLAQLGGNLRSARWSRASTDEVIVASDFDSPAGELYLCNLRASTTRRLTNNGIAEDSADLSPDGERYVYAVDSDSNGRFELVTARLDGSRARTLVPDLDPATGRLWDNRDPVWAPDGAAIAFVARRLDGGATPFDSNYNVAVQPIIIVQQRNDARFDSVIAARAAVFPGPDLYEDRHPAWDEVASNLYYDKFIGGHRQLYTIGVTPGATEIRLTNDLFEHTFPSISFDGRFIAWISTSTVGGRNLDGGSEVLVAEFSRRIDQAGNLTSIRQVTETAAASANSFASFRPLFPGTGRWSNGVFQP